MKLNPILPMIVLAATSLPANAQVRADTTQLETVIVTGTRIPTPRDAMTSTVTVLDGDVLREQGITQVLDALRLVPGLSVVQTGSFGGNTSVFIRGGESDYVKVLLDGVAINDAGGSFDFADLTLDNVDRIELVRGPASVIYGSDAVTGVVQIITKEGAGPESGKMGFRAGTFGSTAADAVFSGAVDRVGYSLAMSRSVTDGIYAFNSDYSSTSVSGKVRVRPDAHSDVSLVLRYLDSEFEFPTDFDGSVVDRNSASTRDRLAVSLDAGRFFTNRLEGRVLLALSDADGVIDDQADGPADTLGFFASNSSVSAQRKSVDFRTNIYAPAATVFVVGVQVEDEDETRTAESQSEFGDSKSSSDEGRSSRGYYAEAQSSPVKGLAVNAGLRVDDNDSFGTFVTYRGGAAYKFASGTRLRASVGRAFKEPTFFENFAAGPFANGNPDLDPERTVSWEVSGEQEFLNGLLVAEVTYFSQRFRNLIQFTSAPANPGDPNFFNVASADASGVELGARVLHRSFSGTVNYTYLDTEVTDAGFDMGAGANFVKGERLLRRPTGKFNVTGRYRLHRLSIGATLLHVAKRDDRDFSTFPATPVTLPSYTKVDLGGEYTIVTRKGAIPGFTLTGRVENLFDVAYQEVLKFPSRGRTIYLGGEVGF
ncbi:MAG: TonB-dependent receptor plug domain-containing protein [Gemmatimonadales bacterium]